MANKAVQDMLNEKEANSPWMSLKHIGDTAKCFRLLKMIPFDKADQSGNLKKVMRLQMLIEVEEGVLVEKTFDNGSKSFLEALMAADIDIGSSFTITRGGENEKEKTKYLFTNVVNLKPGEKQAPAPAVKAPKPPARPTTTVPAPSANPAK